METMPSMMRRAGIRFYATISAILLAVGCTSGQDASPTITISPDGHRNVHYPSLPAGPINPLVARLGIVFGAPSGEEIPLERPSGEMGLDDSGRLYIWDAGTRDIRFFESDGSLLGSMGRYGDGPGEFRGVRALSILGSRLYAFDGPRRRMLVYGLNGTLQDEMVYPGDEILLEVIPFTAGTTVSFVGYLSRMSAVVGGDDSYRYSILLLDSELRVTDVIADSTHARPLREAAYVGNPFERRMAIFTMQPYSPLAWTQGPDYRIDCLDPRTGASWTLEAAGRRRKVGPESKQSYLAQYEGRPDEERVRRTVEFPDHLPEIGNLIWDDRGRLWVWVYERLYESQGTYLFDVFDVEGMFLFSQQLPAHPILIEDGALYVWDELDDGSPVIRQYILEER